MFYIYLLQCHQQSITGNRSGFYAAHHLILAMGQTNLEWPEVFISN